MTNTFGSNAVLLLAATICLSSCTSGSLTAVDAAPTAAVISPVDIVRGGVLDKYNTTTVGKAFEGTFQNAKWTSFETPKGEVVVQFDGSVKSDKVSVTPLGFQKLLDATGCKVDNIFNPTTNQTIAINCIEVKAVAVPVKFQFTLSIDRKTFKVTYVDDIFENNQEQALAFIYQ